MPDPTLREQIRGVMRDVWRLMQVKPWLLFPPFALYARLHSNDPDLPWWLRVDPEDLDDA